MSDFGDQEDSRSILRIEDEIRKYEKEKGKSIDTSSLPSSSLPLDLHASHHPSPQSPPEVAPETAFSSIRNAKFEVANTPIIKLQQKGTTDCLRVSLDAVETYAALLQLVITIYPSQTNPQIVTFDGILLRNELEYNKVKRPGLHLIISFPWCFCAGDPGLNPGGVFPGSSRGFKGPSCHHPVEETEALQSQSVSRGSTTSKLSDDEMRELVESTEVQGLDTQRLFNTYPVTHVMPVKMMFWPPGEMEFEVTIEPIDADGEFLDVDMDAADKTNQSPEKLQGKRVCWKFIAMPRNPEPAALTAFNCGDFNLGDKEIDCVELNEVLPPSLPTIWTSFSKQEGDRTFLLRGVERLQFFLAGFLSSCGVPESEMKVRTNSPKAHEMSWQPWQGYVPLCTHARLLLQRLMSCMYVGVRRISQGIRHPVGSTNLAIA
ncbi:hypothetical protein BZA77DRAFT_304047 [Pyronema omphalodes]|nr:hypothetical protein BZA77DRAFT_304047 [Pyronema omphalodes]